MKNDKVVGLHHLCWWCQSYKWCIPIYENKYITYHGCVIYMVDSTNTLVHHYILHIEISNTSTKWLQANIVEEYCLFIAKYYSDISCTIPFI